MDKSLVKITVFAEDRQKLKTLAAYRGKSMTETFRQMIDECLLDKSYAEDLTWIVQGKKDE